MSIWTMFDMKVELLKKIEALETRIAALESKRPTESDPYRHVSCSVCNLGSYGVATGYVCSRSDCPTRVSC